MSLAFAAASTNVERATAADDAPPAAGQTVTVGKDLTESVSVEVSESLRRNNDGTYTATVSVTNTSGKALDAPLMLVIDSTGVAVLKADKSAGSLATGESVFALLEKGELEDGKGVSLQVGFKSERRLNLPELRRFELKARVIRPAKAAAEGGSKDDPRDRPLAGPGNWPFAGREPISSVTGRPANEGPWPQGHDEDAGGDKDGAAGGEGQAQTQPPKVRLPYEPGPDVTPEAVNQITDLQDQYTPQLLKIDGVAGTATGLDRNGNVVIRVYAERHGVADALPKKIEGIPVDMRVTGQIRRLDTPQDKEGRAGTPGPGFTTPRPERPVLDDPKLRFERPIPIGVSGINGTAGCGTGTIGARVVADDGTVYALSNWHVFTADSNSSAGIGQPILQPGPLDANPICSVDMSNMVGTLAAFVPIDASFFGTNTVDAALANVTTATVSNRTPNGGYGTPRSETAEAFLGMKVLKVGRTTEYTSGIITALNTTIPVGGYLNSFAFFDNQIEIVHPIGVVNPVTGIIDISFEDFGGPGDSGSLIVSASGRQPVALLFAGGGSFVFGNPIDAVLEQLGNQVGKELRIDGVDRR